MTQSAILLLIVIAWLMMIHYQLLRISKELRRLNASHDLDLNSQLGDSFLDRFRKAT